MSHPETPADAIHQLDAEFMKAASARDAAALVAAFYAPEAVLMPPNRPWSKAGSTSSASCRA